LWGYEKHHCSWHSLSLDSPPDLWGTETDLWGSGKKTSADAVVAAKLAPRCVGVLVLESKIEADACRQAKKKGWRSIKMAASSFSQNPNGLPDRLFWKSIQGIFTIRWVEFKAPGGVLSPQQRLRIRELRDAGAIVAVCYSADAALDFLSAAEPGANWYDAAWDL
jgi:hypothetical protein